MFTLGQREFKLIQSIRQAKRAFKKNKGRRPSREEIALLTAQALRKHGIDPVTLAPIPQSRTFLTRKSTMPDRLMKRFLKTQE